MLSLCPVKSHISKNGGMERLHVQVTQNVETRMFPAGWQYVSMKSGFFFVIFISAFKGRLPTVSSKFHPGFFQHKEQDFHFPLLLPAAGPD